MWWYDQVYAIPMEIKNKKCTTTPSTVTKKGLDDMRQWYLYQEIRPLCYDNKYAAYPKSTVPKPEITIV
jgi:hypothetical protein